MKSTLNISLKLLSVLLLVAMISGISGTTMAAKRDKKTESKSDSLKSNTFAGLKWRSIGPAFTSGRIADFAVNPDNNKEYYVATASGHVWKTGNAGVTWSPVFDNHGAYAMGVITMDPNNKNMIWLGTGENNHQRALGYGNGVWKSMDGGSSWKNMGLKESRQIGGIVIDPRNSDIVFVAAEGSVWGPGGDRGLYKTTDGGETWKKVIDISEHTGVNNVVMDPSDPDIMYASSEQRRRHVFTKIGGGPETAIYKSTDGGENWRKLTKGLPREHMGGIGLAVSPVDPGIVYAIIEAANDAGGFFRSTDKGESWTRMSDHHSSGQYYNEIYCDPVDKDVVYSVETVSKVTRDGGKTWENLGLTARHVDDHALWIDPADPEHFIIGGDGGIYESWDGGAHYDFKENLPVTQFYRVMVDNTEPFYWVYGGTQDNNTLGGPSQNTSRQGVSSGEWVVPIGGDGFWVAVDPENPDIVYCEYQYGNMFRYDRKSGEVVYIKPTPRKGEKTYKWNWDTPLIISPHSHKRLYTAANKVFRSDDYGNSWEVISDDITARIDRNTWKVMDHYWSIDAVVKDVSTSLYGMAVALAESPLQEDLLYVGTDDGVISITEDAGESWRQVKSFPGIPANTYVNDIMPSKHDADVVYACFNNIKRDDFKPYLLKSNDKGKSWTSISNNLPGDETVLSLEQDPVDPDLLFAGTEFGVSFSMDGGQEWVELSAGIPDISIKDMVLQERENDLVVATFGRGFYILDDYTPLREFSKEIREKPGHIFPVKTADMYIQTRGRYGQGSTYYTAENPPFGATFNYYLKESPKTLKQMRHEKEKELFREKKPIPQPSGERLRAEENEIPPYLLFTIHDEEGNEVRKLTTRAAKGIQRITWDLKYQNPFPLELPKDEFNPTREGASNGSMLALPGKYMVGLELIVRDSVTLLSEPVPFEARVLDITTMPAKNQEAANAFMEQVANMARNVQNTVRFAREIQERSQYVMQAILETPGLDRPLMEQARQVERQVEDILYRIYGPEPEASWEEIPPREMPLMRRMNAVIRARWSSTSDITQTMRDNYNIIEEEFPPLLDELKSLNNELNIIENKLEEAGAPWTPGRIPKWN